MTSPGGAQPAVEAAAAPKSDPRYRTVAEGPILELLLVQAWPFEVRRGERAQATREAQAALERWLAMGLPFARSSTGERLFDPVEVANFAVWAGVHHDDPTWTRSKDVCRALLHELSADSVRRPGPPLLGEGRPRRFVVDFERRFNLERLPIGARARLRLPAPLEDAALAGLELTPTWDAALAPEIAVSRGRMDAVVAVPAERSVSLGYRASFTAYPTTAAGPVVGLDAADRALYTRFDEGFIQVTPRVRALAIALAEDEHDPWALVTRFWRHVIDKLLFGAVHYDEAIRFGPTDWVIEHGCFDCHLGSALIGALCRASGIPARLVGGYMLYPTTPGPHFWLEVWTEGQGWRPLDLMSWDLSNAGRDDVWRDYFFGRLECRMKTQVLPRLFSNAGAVRFPTSWRQLAHLTDRGTAHGYYDNEDGGLIYEDQISVTRLDRA